MFKSISKILISSLLAVCLLVSGCATTSAPPSSSPTASETSSPVVDAQPVSGGKLNQFFPKSQGDYQVTFRQEKTGFSQAKLSQGGEDVALLSINDIANNPSAARKFEESSQAIGGYPAANQGKSTTAILVGDRYQVKVKSNVDSFGQSEREQWLQEFNLNGLASLK